MDCFHVSILCGLQSADEKHLLLREEVFQQQRAQAECVVLMLLHVSVKVAELGELHDRVLLLKAGLALEISRPLRLLGHELE